MRFKLTETLTEKVYQVYHGSPYKFNKFSLKNFGKHDAGQWGKGIYFTDNEKIAKEFTEGDGYIYTANVVLDNPLIIDASNPNKVANVIMEKGSEEATEYFKSQGYDGIIVKDDLFADPDDITKQIKADQIIVFNPENTNIIQIADLGKLVESLYTHDRLNPKLFDNDGNMYVEVSDRLVTIANKFIEELQENNIPLKVYDYWVVGSNAAYNYVPGVSDIDLHIIVDMDIPGNNPEILQLLYNYAKSNFNNKHDIFVKGQPVEVYLEDIKTSAVSNGIYSLGKNEWIKKPEPLEEVEINIEETPEYNEWYDRYTDVKESDDIDKIKYFINDLYLMRKESLVKDGEFGTGNLIFKEFRNLDILQELKDKIVELEDKELTLEGLNKNLHEDSSNHEGEKAWFEDIKNEEGEVIGSIGFSYYDDIKALGIGSFEIKPEYRDKGYGTQVIKNIIEKYKDKCDLIYCFVDSDNYGAIKLYKKLGKVFDEEGPNDNNQYYVEFYDKDNKV